MESLIGILMVSLVGRCGAQPEMRQSTLSFPLLKTTWGQTGASSYALYTPKHVRLGCESTALAQLMFYHKRCPTGKVSYTVTGYGTTAMNFDEEKSSLCDWRSFSDKPPHKASAPAMQHVARYSYANALVVEKTWGTGDYHGNGCGSVEDHYPGVSCVPWSLGESHSRDELVDRIRKDLDVGFPSLLRIAKKSGGVHWIVVDGYKTTGSDFQVHLNLGHEDQSGENGWYNFDAPIGSYDDVNSKLSRSIRFTSVVNVTLV